MPQGVSGGVMLCRDCCEPMTATERHYYGTRCERCEQEWHERITEWRTGGADKELDEMYSVPRTIQ